MRLENKVAVVTGAGSGIGKEIARLFVREGAKVVIADHNQERADEVAKELGTERAIGIAVDVTDEAQVEACFAKTVALLGQVDILVSNAGIQSVAPIEEFDFGKWRQLLAVHLDGAFLTTRAALRHMHALGRGGSIIYMGSVHSKEASVLKAPYVTAKHGLIGLAKVVAKEGGQARGARQCRLPRIRAHPVGRQADPTAGSGTRHFRAGSDPKRHAQGNRRRRVHHRRRRGGNHLVPCLIRLQRPYRPVGRGEPRLAYAITFILTIISK